MLGPCLRSVLSSFASLGDAMTVQDVFMLAGRCVDAWLDTFTLFSRAVAPKNRPTVDDAEAVWRGVTLLAGEVSKLSGTTVGPGDLLPRHLIDAFIQMCVSAPKEADVEDASLAGITNPAALAAARAKAEVSRRRADAVLVAKGTALKFNSVVRKLEDLYKSMLSDARRNVQLCTQVRERAGGRGGSGVDRGTPQLFLLLPANPARERGFPPRAHEGLLPAIVRACVCFPRCR